MNLPKKHYTPPQLKELALNEVFQSRDEESNSLFKKFLNPQAEYPEISEQQLMKIAVENQDTIKYRR